LPLSPGDRIGPYEILAVLGAGGMGQVYRAKDTRLGRIVAVKALHETFAGHPERVARFEREAQLLASLNHPNIAAIYGVEESQGATYLVLEFVDGHSLGEVLKAGALPVREAKGLARQIAEALGAAHERGIVHRDFKPGNVVITPEGQAKVLDFGLAKSVDGDGSAVVAAASGPSGANSPTMTTAGTELGVILGTAGYMSPEQAKGRPTDRRTDVWAFGCVLYEMLTGRKAFEGEDITETLAAIVRGEPDWTALPANLPPNLRVLLTRCLIKDRAERVADMSVVRFLLSETATSLSGTAMTAPPDAPPSAWRRIAPIVVATAVVAVVATLGAMRFLVAPSAITGGGVTHVSVPLPDGVELGSVQVLPIAISKDGTEIAYVGSQDGKNRIYVRALREPEAKALEGTEGGDGPFFSPDGQWIGFFAGSKLRRIAVSGAAPQTLADAPTHRGGDWGDDGYIYYSPANIGSIWRVPEGGGAATEVTHKLTAEGEVSHRWPRLIPGTKTLVFSLWTGPGDDEHHVAVQTVGAAEHRVLVRGGTAPRYAAKPGMLIYVQLGELFAVPWGPAQTDVGRSVPITTTEHPNDSFGNEGAGNFTLSDGGTLAYIAGGRARNADRLVWVDRAGAVQPTSLPERNYENAAMAPDGSRAIVQIREGLTRLWMYDFAQNTLAPIGSSAGSDQAPLWTPDGTRVIYRGTRQGTRNLYWRPVDGSAAEERLSVKAEVVHTPTSISSDGRWLIFNEGGPQQPGGSNIYLLGLDGDRTPRPLFADPAGEQDGQISPDGRWVAYQASVSSRQEIYVTPFPGPGPRRQVSTDGGTEPAWSHDGRELYFQNGTQLMGVTVNPGATFSAGAPHLVHEGRFLKTVNGNTSWSVAPDGKRFLRIQQVEPERPVTRIDLVLNWFDELRSGAAAAR